MSPGRAISGPSRWKSQGGRASGEGAGSGGSWLLCTPVADAHDLPALALQHPRDGAVEEGAIGGRHLEAEGVVMGRDDAAADLGGRGTDEIAKQLTGAISHGPGGRHDTDTPKARAVALNLAHDA